MVAANDEAIPSDAERRFAARLGATAVEVPAGHLAMISHAGEVVNLIEVGRAPACAARGAAAGRSVRWLRADLGGLAGVLDDRFEFLQLAANAAAHLVAEVEHGRIADRVAGVGSLLVATHHASGVEDAEVLRDILLGCPERVLQFADGRIAVTQPVKKLDPRRLAEHAEALGDELDQRLWQRVRNGGGVGHALTVAQAHSCGVDNFC